MSGRPAGVRRLLASHAAASIGMSLIWPLLLVLVWDEVGGTTHGQVLVGLTAAARMLPYVLLSWATGSLGDRYRRDLVLRSSLWGRIASLLVVALAVAQGWLLVAVLVGSTAVVFGTPAYPLLAAAIPDVAGEGRRRATDALVTIEVGSFVVGPALGGLMLLDATRGWIPLLAAGFAAAGLVLVTGLRLPMSALEAGGAGSIGGMFRQVRGTPSVIGALAVVALLNLAGGAAGVALLPMAENVWGAGSRGFGLATACLGFGALGAPLLWWLRGSAVRRRRLGLCLVVAPMIAVAGAPTLGWALVPLVLIGAAAVQVESAITETIQDGVPDVHRAGALGLGDSVMVGAGMIGALVAPWCAELVGSRAVFLGIAAVGVAAVAIRGGVTTCAQAGRIWASCASSSTDRSRCSATGDWCAVINSSASARLAKSSR